MPALGGQAADPRRGPAIAANIAKLPGLPLRRETPETASGLLWPGAGHPGVDRRCRRCDQPRGCEIIGQGAGHRRARWTSALNHSWRTFSALAGEEPDVVRDQVRVALGDYAAIFWAQEPNKLMKDKSARGCRVLCRDRVAEELERRRGTPIAEHLKSVLTIIDWQVH